jgi:L-threonylcarbamoyladenylate synthase
MASNHVPTVVPSGAEQIAQAAQILRDGGLVAFPTETVYGLGADATDDRAVASIFEAKGRPRFNPLIVHVRNAKRAGALAEFSGTAAQLAERFWPGPLTLVVRRKPDCPLSLLVSAGLDTVALRIPAHPVAQQLLAETDLPIAAPSANRSGHVSATTAAHVADDLGARVQLVLDSGATPHGIESTVIGFDGERAVLLRLGAIVREDLEALVGPLMAPTSGRIASPGQLASHYAPRAALRLDAKDAQEGEALLAFGPDVPNSGVVRNLSPSGDPTEAATNLFAMLRELDAVGARSIAVMPIPEHGLGEAINDRLRRAAAPRDE